MTHKEAFEQWYVENAHDYASNPIGSRDCGLQRAAWNAAREYLAAPEQHAPHEALARAQGMAIELDSVLRMAESHNGGIVSVKLVRNSIAPYLPFSTSPQPKAPEQSEPVEYRINGINGRGEHSVVFIKPFVEDWVTDDGGLGEYWSGNDLLCALATPQPKAEPLDLHAKLVDELLAETQPKAPEPASVTQALEHALHCAKMLREHAQTARHEMSAEALEWLVAYVRSQPKAPEQEPADSMGIPLSCGKPLCAPGAHHPLCTLAAPEQGPLDVTALLTQFERQAHRKGELWERCQGKGWPTAESEEFAALRDEKLPSIRAELLALYTNPAPKAEPVNRMPLSALKEVQRTLHDANEAGGPITDTIWYSPYETLFDYIAVSIAAAEQAPQPAELTDTEIDEAWHGMPDGAAGFLKTWGYRQFARAVLAAQGAKT